MFVIPQKVVVTSIKNTVDNHIVIEAQAEKYEQLGYFVAKLKNERILSNVTASSGKRENDDIVVDIKGELPY